MRMFLALSWMLCLGTPTWAAVEPVELTFTASDGISLAADWYHGSLPKAGILVVAPGFAQHKGTPCMKFVAQGLAAQSDVVVLDFRGTGRSQGKFNFGSKEYLDLEPVLAWARLQSSDVRLLGFSLGAYSALRAAVLHPGLVDRLFLVSCPTRIGDILLGGGAILNPLALLFRHPKLQGPSKGDMFFRWGPLFTPNPSASEFAKGLKTPVGFLVAGKDTLVFESQTQRVFDAVPSQKTWLLWPEGLHAELMFLQNPRAFVAWIARRD